jgi:dihydrolipoamide dehydrogenase
VPDTQLAVIGAGPGGYAAAFLAADMGLSATLIDLESGPGGVCLLRGCIPSKALLHVAKLLDESQEAKNLGVTFGKPKIDLDRMRSWKSEVIRTHSDGLLDLAKRRKADYIQGRARFQNARTLAVEKPDGTTQTLSFDHAVIATGSHPARLPGFPESPRILDSTSALEIETVPKRLLVVGGGYIGLELGTVYAALGSKVTVVEMMDSLLPGMDKDLLRPLAKRLERQFTAIHLGAKVTAVEEQKNGVKVRLEGEGIETPEQVFDRVLVSVGRKPSGSGLGLETTGIRPDPRGFIPVDSKRRTAEPNIFAVGDVVGEPMLAHKSTHEGRTAAEVIVGKPVTFEPKAIPAVVFTDPEIAWAGLTENDAKTQGRTVKVARFPWAASGRASTLDRHDGMTKLVVDPESERILGVGICGPGAGELIAEGVLAVEMAATAKDLELSIHPHPTLSETVMEAAGVFFGTSTNVYKPRRK